MLTKEPEMLQPDAFCEHTMQQNATAAGAPPAYSAPPDLVAGFKGAASQKRGGEGKERKRKGGRGRERGGGKGEGSLTLMCSWNRAADWLVCLSTYAGAYN